MPEKKDEKLPGGELHSPKREAKLSGGEMHSPFVKWIENFWYHYKWPFLAAVFGIVVLAALLVQCVGNGKGDDVTLMYAGNCTLTVEEARDISATVQGFTADRNGDGKATAGLRNYAIYTNKEIEAFTPQQQGHLKQMSYDNRQNFDQEIYSGEATLCFLSPSLFEDLCEAGALIPVSEYTGLPDTAVTESYGDVAYGVRLSSLPLYTYPGFSGLPENTILCLRTNTSMGAFLGGNSTKAMHEANLALAWRLLAAPVYVPESN